MLKIGQARALTAEQQGYVFDVIQHHRHHEKNSAIMQISFKLGLRAQEIALLQVKEIAKLNPTGTSFKLLEVMSLLQPTPRRLTPWADPKVSTSGELSVSMWGVSIRSFAKLNR